MYGDWMVALTFDIHEVATLDTVHPHFKYFQANLEMAHAPDHGEHVICIEIEVAFCSSAHVCTY